MTSNENLDRRKLLAHKLGFVEKSNVGGTTYQWILNSPDGRVTESELFHNRLTMLSNCADTFAAALYDGFLIEIDADIRTKDLLLFAVRKRSAPRVPHD